MSLYNGFLIVASQIEGYVRSANFAAATIKDYYPEAHITLFVTKQLEQFVDRSVFDKVVSENVPSHMRTKLYALSKTPYSNLTVYVDADMECQHEDVKTVWDQIPNDVDIMITKIRPYNGKIAKWANGEMIHHGGFFIYRNNPHTMEFMERWWVDYTEQHARPWPYKEHPKELQPWDQFTFWKMLNIDKMKVNVQFLEDDARWNFVNGYKLNENKKPIIFYHHTLPDALRGAVK